MRVAKHRQKIAHPIQLEFSRPIRDRAGALVVNAAQQVLEGRGTIADFGRKLHGGKPDAGRVETHQVYRCREKLSRPDGVWMRGSALPKKNGPPKCGILWRPFPGGNRSGGKE